MRNRRVKTLLWLGYGFVFNEFSRSRRGAPFKLRLGGDVHPSQKLPPVPTKLVHALGTETLSTVPAGTLPDLQLLSPPGKPRDDAARACFESSLERVRQAYGLCVYGYVVMPEHVHLLINEPERGCLAQVLQSLKQSVARTLALRANKSLSGRRVITTSTCGASASLSRVSATSIAIRCIGDWWRRPEDWPWSSFRHYAHRGRRQPSKSSHNGRHAGASA